MRATHRHPSNRSSSRTTARSRGIVLGASLSVFALACCGVVVACSIGDGADSSSSDIDLDDAGADADAAPRRVCPSEQRPDGGWITVDGLDTSDWEYVDWNEVALRQPNLRFGFARVSAGLVRVDTRFGRDWAGMKRAGLIRGAYQYFKPSQSAIAQADLLLERLREEGGLGDDDLPPVLDMETSNDMPAATVACRVKLWLSRVERATRRTPIVYTSIVWSSYFSSDFARYPLWVANYVGTPSVTCPRMPDAWDKWRMWQWAEAATVWGIYSNGSRDDDAGGSIAYADAGDGGDGGPIIAGSDLNFFDGTIDELRAFVRSTVSTGIVPEPEPIPDPPHVGTADGGIAPDCSDGCCIADP